MTNRAIITPTYIGHFVFIKKYLKSFDKYLINKDFPIYFIIEKKEQKKFDKIVKPYKHRLNINVCYLEDIFEKYEIKETPAEVLKIYGRLSFQTIKKFYGGLYSGADEFFFLDSESMLIKPTDFNRVFDEYFKHPNFFVSRTSQRHEGYKETFVYNYVCTVAKLLGIEPEYWTVESYEWFYKKEILQDLIKELGSPINIIKQAVPTGKFPDLEGVLEALLYYLFILKNNDKYKYDIIITQDEFKKYLGEKKYLEFRKNFDDSHLNVAGLYELCTYFITDENVDAFIRIFNDNNIHVMRFTCPNNNYLAQKKVIDNTSICILPSEQEHLFGINNTKLAVMSCKNNATVYYNKLLKHVSKFSILKPLEIISIVFYFTKLFIKILFKGN